MDTLYLQGIGVSEGVRIAPAFIYRRKEVGGAPAPSELPGDPGAMFRVSLPLLQLDRTPEELSGAIPGIDRHDQPLRGVRVFVVDDDHDARDVVSRILRLAGAETESLPDASSLLTTLAERTPDVLVCDLAMPDLDGFTLIQRVRQQERGSATHIPAIALTALVQKTDRERALQSGFEEFVQKPFDPSDLIRVVERWAARAR